MPEKAHASIPSRDPTTDAVKGQDMRKVMRHCRSSWCLPLAGFTVTFICGVGLSLSNTNIRADVQSIGLGLFVLWTVLGLYGTMRACKLLNATEVGLVSRIPLAGESVPCYAPR